VETANGPDAAAAAAPMRCRREHLGHVFVLLQISVTGSPNLNFFTSFFTNLRINL